MFDPVEFKIGERTYRATRLNAFQEDRVVRRLAPAMTSLLSLRDGGDEEKNAVSMFENIASAIAKLSDADADAVFSVVLSVVSVQVGPAWQKLQPVPGRLMFDDLNAADLYQIVWHVLREQLQGFFHSFQLASAGISEPEASTR